MARLVTHEDLGDLVSSPTEVQKAIDAVEACTQASHEGAAGQVIFGDVALEGSDYMKVLASAAPGWDMSLQIFPAQANGPAAADSRVMMIFDGVSGSLKALFAADDLSAMRTSVPAALGARHLAPPDARVLGILGSGYQAGSHALTITTAVPMLQEVRIWSPTEANRERFAQQQSAVLGLPVNACATAKEVVEAADIVTATGRTAPGASAYDAGWVKPGALLISMTGSAPRELHGVARFVVPTKQRPERVAFGFTGVSVPKPVSDPEGSIELSNVVESSVGARERPSQAVIWELANVYLWDLAIVRWAYDWAMRKDVGLSFALSRAPG